MAILFISPNDDPRPWAAAFADARPDLDFRTNPAVGNRDAIRYALAWKPPPGLLASLPNLSLILSLGAGVDALLSDPTFPAKVPLVRMVDPGLSEGMVEHVVGQVLAWHRNALHYRAAQARRQWKPLPEMLARERKVTVLGLGVLGGAVAAALAQLRFDVSGWSRSPRQVAGVACHHGPGGLDEAISGADFVVCLLPLTQETRGILGRTTFARMKRGAVVINVARGDHVVDHDLLTALDSGQLAGASLDVFAEEPLPPGHPFWTHPGIIVTPHTAAQTHARTAARVALQSIEAFEAGKPVPHLVDRQQGY